MTLQRTSLFEQHVALGAKIVPFAGWEMPVQYSSVKEEVIAVRSKAGLFDVSHMGEFFVEGPDAQRFCDHLVTNSIIDAPIGKAIYSPLCREDGTVIDDLIIYKLAIERMLICVNASNIEKDFNWIKNQAKGFMVKLNNRSEEFSLLALQGPQSYVLLKKVLNDLPEMEYYSVWEDQWEGHEVIVARTGYTGEDGFEIFAHHACIGFLWSELIRLGAMPCGLAARDVLRMEVAYPLYGHEIDDTVTPLDAALGWTVKMNKPAFVGKSALENYKPKFKQVKLLVDKGIPREGYNIQNAEGEVVGKVTSGTMSVTLGQGVALARIKAEKVTPTISYFVDIRGKLYSTQTMTKAFVKGGHK